MWQKQNGPSVEYLWRWRCQKSLRFLLNIENVRLIKSSLLSISLLYLFPVACAHSWRQRRWQKNPRPSDYNLLKLYNTQKAREAEPSIKNILLFLSLSLWERFALDSEAWDSQLFKLSFKSHRLVVCSWNIKVDKETLRKGGKLRMKLIHHRVTSETWNSLVSCCWSYYY